MSLLHFLTRLVARLLVSPQEEETELEQCGVAGAEYLTEPLQ